MKKACIYINILIGTILLSPSCKKMDDTYKDFIVPSGKVYPAKAAHAKVYSGKNRVKVSWLASPDQTLEKARIFWNNFTDSIDITIPRDKDTINCLMSNLAENNYSFMIHTYDHEGNISVPVEVSGKSYGDLYQSSIYTRIIKSLTTDVSGKVTIAWETADITNGAQDTKIWYTDLQGEEKTAIVASGQQEITIADYQFQTPFKYRTKYLPDSTCIDVFYSDFIENEQYFTLEKKGWSIAAFSSQVNTTDANVVGNVIDGNSTTTRWHSANVAYPHWVTIDFGGEVSVAKFGVWASTVDVTAAPGFDVRLPGRVRFEVSTDNTNWTNLGEFPFEVKNEQFFEVTPTRARYYRFTGLGRGSSNTGNYMVIGELDVYCK